MGAGAAWLGRRRLGSRSRRRPGAAHPEHRTEPAPRRRRGGHDRARRDRDRAPARRATRRRDRRAHDGGRRGSRGLGGRPRAPRAAAPRGAGAADRPPPCGGRGRGGPGRDARSGGRRRRARRRGRSRGRDGRERACGRRRGGAHRRAAPRHVGHGTRGPVRDDERRECVRHRGHAARVGERLRGDRPARAVGGERPRPLHPPGRPVRGRLSAVLARDGGHRVGLDRGSGALPRGDGGRHAVPADPRGADRVRRRTLASRTRRESS